MKKFLVLAAVVFTGIVLAVPAFAAEEAAVQAPVATTTVTTTTTTTTTQPFGGRFKIEGYAEYIKFNGGDIGKGTFGGGILARYMFLDWLGAQTNFSFYSDCGTKELPGDLALTNWRLDLILHTYLPDICDQLYIYGGAGLGYQFNDNIGDVKIDDALTGNILVGLGYDINEVLSVEAEVGYQFGKADAENYKDDEIGLEALFVRAGLGIRF
jgi:hypothetical protein